MTTPHNHNKVWTSEDKYVCGHHFVTTKSVKKTADLIGRTQGSTLAMLESLHLITRNWQEPDKLILNENKFHRYETPPASFCTDDEDPAPPLNAAPSTTQGTVMDKNIAALLKEDTYTVAVTFDANDTGPDGAPSQRKNTRPYTFVCDVPGLQIGDVVIVDTINGFKVGNIVKVDDDLRIEPNSEIKYRWVVQQVSIDDFLLKQAKLEELELLLTQSYQANLRRSFAQSVLANLPDDGARDKIAGLLK